MKQLPSSHGQSQHGIAHVFLIAFVFALVAWALAKLQRRFRAASWWLRIVGHANRVRSSNLCRRSEPANEVCGTVQVFTVGGELIAEICISRSTTGAAVKTVLEKILEPGAPFRWQRLLSNSREIEDSDCIWTSFCEDGFSTQQSGASPATLCMHLAICVNPEDVLHPDETVYAAAVAAVVDAGTDAVEAVSHLVLRGQGSRGATLEKVLRRFLGPLNEAPRAHSLVPEADVRTDIRVCPGAAPAVESSALAPDTLPILSVRRAFKKRTRPEGYRALCEGLSPLCAVCFCGGGWSTIVAGHEFVRDWDCGSSACGFSRDDSSVECEGKDLKALCLLALREAGITGVRNAQALLSDSHVDIRRNAVRLLMELAASKPLSDVHEFPDTVASSAKSIAAAVASSLESDNPDIRAASADAMGAIASLQPHGRWAVTPHCSALLDLLQDSHAKVRLASAQALRSLGHVAAPRSASSFGFLLRRGRNGSNTTIKGRKGSVVRAEGPRCLTRTEFMPPASQIHHRWDPARLPMSRTSHQECRKSAGDIDLDESHRRVATICS